MAQRSNVWHIGAVKVTRIAELGRNVRLPNFVFRNLSVEDVRRQEWLQPHFATDEGKLISSNHAFIIECGSRRIIVDTCIGNDKNRRTPFWNRLQGPFLADLAEAGYPAETIDTVLCTHLHVDHVGWNTRLVDGRWVPTFPNARYLFGRREWEHWSQDLDSDLDGDVVAEVANTVLEAKIVYQDSILPIINAGLHTLVETSHRISDEIVLEPTPGHTPGHVSVRISSRGQHAVISGDLMHHPIQCAMPKVSSNFDFDILQTMETREKFLQRHCDRPVLVLGTHFASPTGGWIVAHEDAWRFSVFEPG